MLCFVAVSPSLGTAVAALGRLVLYLVALVYLLSALRPRAPRTQFGGATPIIGVILLACAYMAVSALWSSVPLDDAWLAWTRHARLLTVVIVYYLISNSAQGLVVLRAFTFAQIFVVLSAWLLVAGIHAPWVTAKYADDTYAVFGSYLEQSISQSVLAAILWFQRDTIFGVHGRWLAIFLALTTLLLTLGFLQGRSGHLVALGMLTLACMHAMSRKWRWFAIAVPFLAFALLMSSSETFRTRMLQVVSEVTEYSKARESNQSIATVVTNNSSSGERLVYWGTSMQAIKERPLLGHGAGSWNLEYRKLGGDKLAPPTTDNPHQLFLLWAVEGGIVGMAMLIAVLWTLFAFSKHLQPPDAFSLQALVAALVISGMFNSMIFGIGMGDFFCVGFGILLAMHKQTSGLPTPSHHAKSY